jgi:hypothetical protein
MLSNTVDPWYLQACGSKNNQIEEKLHSQDTQSSVLNAASALFSP